MSFCVVILVFASSSNSLKYTHLIECHTHLIECPLYNMLGHRRGPQGNHSLMWKTDKQGHIVWLAVLRDISRAGEAQRKSVH